MNKEREKAKKISNQLVDLLLANRVNDMQLNVNINPGLTLIEIKGNLRDTDLDVQELERILSVPRTEEYDDYYDELLGNGNDDALRYVGYLCDEAKMTVLDDNLHIKLKRIH